MLVESVFLVPYHIGAYVYRYLHAIAHPITFPYKHVLITGCGTGLGKALVQEIYMKGAYITMLGRDGEKLQKLALSVDVKYYRLIV